MELRAPPIPVPEDSPFEHDKLHRQECAQVLTQFVSSLSHSFVLAVDAPWGQGKTTFLRMWIQHLKNDGFPTMYFNAWENDFSGDALVSLLGELETSLDELRKAAPSPKRLKHRFTKAKKMAVQVLRRSVPAAARMATYGLVDLDKVSEDALAQISEKLAADAVEQYIGAKDSIREFKEALTGFVHELRASDEESNRPLVICIDELDRCRPSYAVEMLEKAKHLFDVDGVVFVLALDKSQLGHSIRCLYGQRMDVDGYLRRFIDMDYRLPRPSKAEFCHALYRRFDLSVYFSRRETKGASYEPKELVNCLSELFAMWDFSLRVQEQCFARLAIVLRTTPPNYLLFIPLLSFLLCLKIAEPERYVDLIDKQSDPEEIVTWLRSVPGGQAFMQSAPGIHVEVYLVGGLSDRHGARDDAFRRYEALVNNAEAPEPERIRAGHIVGLVSSFYNDEHYTALDYLVKKIELAEQFHDHSTA